MEQRKLFPTQEIGSLQKPKWQLMGQRGSKLDAEAMAEFRKWNDRMPFALQSDPDVQRLLGAAPEKASPEAVQDLAAKFMITMLDHLGLDRVYDGEARRIEMYEYAARRINGLDLLGHVRSFDNKYYLKGAVTGEIGLDKPYHVEEFEFVRDNSFGTPHLPITGPYTMADWSYNQFYLDRQRGWKGRDAKRAAKRDLVVDFARKAIRPTLEALIAQNCQVIQIDEPAAGTIPSETDLVVEGFNEATKGLDAEFSMHVCFSDYSLMFPAILEAKNCRQWAWEFANRDALGNDSYRDILSLFAEHKDDREIGLGVLNVHTNDIETPELVRDRILRSAKIIDPYKLWINPDCGLRTRSLDVAYAKLENMVKGAKMARKELGGDSE